MSNKISRKQLAVSALDFLVNSCGNLTGFNIAQSQQFVRALEALRHYHDNSVEVSEQPSAPPPQAA